MTYPQTVLTRPVRRGIMVILIVLFCIISPAIILYTAGYRYDFQQGRIKQTGVVSIDVHPSDARVFLNDIEMKRRMPMRLPNRAPGTYRVRIERDGFHTWHQEVTVDSNQTTYIKDVSLFAQNLPMYLRERGDIVETRFSHDGQYMLATARDGDLYSVHLYEVAQDTWTTVARHASKPDILWSPFHAMAAIITRDARGVRIERIDPQQQQLDQLYSFPSLEQQFQWNQHRPILYVQSSDDVYALSDTKKHVSSVNSTKWFIENDETVWQFNDAAHRLVSRADSVMLQRGTVVKNIIAITDTFLILQTLRGIEIIQREEKQSITIPANNIRYDTRFDRWIAWSAIELWTIHADGSEHLEDRLSNTTIQEALPLNTHHSLLFTTRNSIETVNPGYNTHNQLFANVQIEDIAVSEQVGTILFFGTLGKKEGLFALPLHR